MSSHRPLRPLSPLSANFTGPGPAHLDKVGGHEDAHTAMSDISGLTDLENEGGTDAFDLMMLQNEREQRRLNALRGNVQPFRKARVQPRVGLTMQNLERHGAFSNGARAMRSPSSSSGASDPAIQPPREWGRRARVKKNWLRTITVEPEAGAGMEGKRTSVQEETPRQTTPRATVTGPDAPRPSIEDSPLSHKGSRHGTPASTRRPIVHFDREQSLDFSIDFNEASMIASTPYIPRNTLLDEIRQREIDSHNEQEEPEEPELDEMGKENNAHANEQACTTNHWDKLRAKTLEEPPRPSMPVKGPTKESRVTSPNKARPRKTPLHFRQKSSETVGLVDPALSANAQSNPPRPTPQQDESHHLLRQLARLSSNTPSPSGPSVTRTHSSSEKRQESSPFEVNPESNATPAKEDSLSQGQPKNLSSGQLVAGSPKIDSPPQSPKDTGATNVDATPAQNKPSPLDMKTPVVTGAWVDTPAQRTIRKSSENPRRSASRPHGEESAVLPQEESSKRAAARPETQQKPPEVTRPTLPRSAVEAIVNEARSNGDKLEPADEYGDSTIESLEGLMGQDGEGAPEPVEVDDDTLQGLQLPTTAPRTEAERQRQQEVAQLHSMRRRLNMTRTSVRDANRGLRRVEHQVEHSEDQGYISQVCPCAVNGHHNGSTATSRRSFLRLFYKAENGRFWGLTWLGVASVLFWLWFISENLAW